MRGTVGIGEPTRNSVIEVGCRSSNPTHRLSWTQDLPRQWRALGSLSHRASTFTCYVISWHKITLCICSYPPSDHILWHCWLPLSPKHDWKVKAGNTTVSAVTYQCGARISPYWGRLGKMFLYVDKRWSHFCKRVWSMMHHEWVSINPPPHNKACVFELGLK